MTLRLVDKVISGAQTGADQAGLEAAYCLGIPTGGHCTHRCLTEEGQRPELIEKYNLTEMIGSWMRTDYPARTKENIMNSTGTLIFTMKENAYGAGTKLTIRQCTKKKKPYKIIDLSRSHEYNLLCARIFLTKLDIFQYGGGIILNIAGSRESSQPGIQQTTREFLMELLDV